MLAGTIVASTVHAATPAVELVATCRVAGDSQDLSGLTGADAEGVPHALLGAFGSGIDFDTASGIMLAVCDRGPRDGDNDFACRVQCFGLTIAGRSATLTLKETHLLRSAGGGQFVGSSKAVGPALRAQVGQHLTRIPARLDPESIRVVRDGSFWVAEEYGPSLDHFDATGRHLCRVTVPDRYRCATPAASTEAELAANSSGRQPNRGFEGLSLSPDGAMAWLMTQSPLLQDHGLDGDRKRVGINMRLLRAPLDGGRPAEYLYLLDRPTHGVNELLVDDGDHLLVLERDGKGGAEAVARTVYRVDVSRASDISGVDVLPVLGIPPGVTPVHKEVFLDLMDPAFGLAGGCMPEKIEGLAWGPALEDGRRTLLVSSDNDMRGDAPSVVWVFAIGPAGGR